MVTTKKIVILGAGESGVGAALLAQAKGFDIFVSDAGEILEKYKKILSENNISFEEKITPQSQPILFLQPNLPQPLVQIFAGGDRFILQWIVCCDARW